MATRPEPAAARWLRDIVLARLPGRIARHGHAALRRAALARLAHETRPIALLATHDLSRSGAPLLVFEIARLLRQDGYAPVVVSPLEGPFGATLRDIGVPVLVDSAIADAPAWLRTLADRATIALCNTIETAAVAAALAPRVPTLWYLHEVSLLEARLPDAAVRTAIATVARVWAGSAMCADLLAPVRADVTIVPYGVSPLGDPPKAAPGTPLRIGVFGSIEPRKGQDLAVAGYALLTPEERSRIALTLYGRTLVPDFAASVARDAAATGVALAGELDRDGYEAAMRATDAVLVSSRDDTLPIVSIDALGLGRMLLLVPGVGTKAWLTPGTDALVADATSAEGIAGLFRAALARRDDAVAIGAAARRAFDTHFSPAAFHARLAEAVAGLTASRSPSAPSAPSAR